MPERAVDVSLEFAGVPSVTAVGRFDEFTLPQRIKRSGFIMLTAVLLAGSLLPIPIIHLVGPPMFLLLGAITAIRQLSSLGRLLPLRLPCPKCGEPNRVGGGLGIKSLEPKERMCESCRRELLLRIVPIADSQVPVEAARTS